MRLPMLVISSIKSACKVAHLPPLATACHTCSAGALLCIHMDLLAGG